MVKITGVYTGEKHCNAEHEPSKKQLETDAPKDNQGRGESFSPTDLMATALGTCALTTMAIVAERDGVDLKNSRMQVIKEMSANPRRIASLKTRLELPSSLPVDYRRKLEQIAETCPVKRSLHPDISAEIEFVYNI